MKYFTRKWARGDLDEDTYNRVVSRYEEFLNTLDHSSTVWRFAKSISLNDAYLDRVAFDRPHGNLKLLLVTGDNQIGYWRTELSYAGAQIIEGEEVLKQALAARPTEIWYDEFDRDERGMIHAFLIDPNLDQSSANPGEFRVACERFDFSQSPAGRRILSTEDNRSVWG